MEQITVTLNKETLEQLPQSVLVALLMGQQEAPAVETVEPVEVAPLATAVNDNLLSLFPTVEPTPYKKGKNTNRKWTRKDDLALIYGHSKGHMSFEQLAEQLGRNAQGIKMRIYRLQLEGRL